MQQNLRPHSTRLGQGSLELLVVAGLALILLAIVFATTQTQYIGTQSGLAASQAHTAAQDFVQTSDAVSGQGIGARQRLFITLPDATNYAYANCTNTASVGYSTALGDTESNAQARRSFCCTNQIPQQGGQFEFLVESTPTCVSITQVSPATPATSFSIDPPVVYALLSYPGTNSSTQTLTVTNLLNTSLPVTLAINWNQTSGITANFVGDGTTTTLTVPALSASTAQINFTTSANALGNYVGSLTANASDGNSTTAQLSATVLTSGTTGGGGASNVSEVVVNAYNDSTYGSRRFIFPAPDAVSVTGGGWPPSSTVTVTFLYPNNTVISSNTSVPVNSTGNFLVVFNPAGYAAAAGYGVSVTNGISAATTAFTVNACPV